jgi:hypothetical protein
MDNQQPHGRIGRVKPPPGAPGWVTEELVAQTLETWQSLADRLLTPNDALAMLINISQLFEVVGLTSPEENDP